MDSMGFIKGIKQPGREAEHPPLFTPNVKNVFSFIFTSPYAFILKV
jgi:hypothetical protein